MQAAVSVAHRSHRQQSAQRALGRVRDADEVILVVDMRMRAPAVAVDRLARLRWAPKPRLKPRCSQVQKATTATSDLLLSHARCEKPGIPSQVQRQTGLAHQSGVTTPVSVPDITKTHTAAPLTRCWRSCPFVQTVTLVSAEENGNRTRGWVHCTLLLLAAATCYRALPVQMGTLWVQVGVLKSFAGTPWAHLASYRSFCSRFHRRTLLTRLCIARSSVSETCEDLGPSLPISNSRLLLVCGCLRYPDQVRMNAPSSRGRHFSGASQGRNHRATKLGCRRLYCSTPYPQAVASGQGFVPARG
eukprot:174481-Rhodomonas_salina.1